MYYVLCGLMTSTKKSRSCRSIDSPELSLQVLFSPIRQSSSILRVSARPIRQLWNTKFLTNSSELQQRIDLNEGTLSESAETHAQATLGDQPPGASNECEILGGTWYHNTDCLRFNVISLAQIADNLSLTKRKPGQSY